MQLIGRTVRGGGGWGAGGEGGGARRGLGGGGEEDVSGGAGGRRRGGEGHHSLSPASLLPVDESDDGPAPFRLHPLRPPLCLHFDWPHVRGRGLERADGEGGVEAGVQVLVPVGGVSQRLLPFSPI